MNAVQRLERAGDAAIGLLGNRWFAALIIFFVLAIVVLDDPAADPDMFARVAAGRLVERDGGVSKTDPFAYTPKHEHWVDHEWLTGVVLWDVARAAGDRGLLLLALACMAATVVLVAAGQLRFDGKAQGAGAWLFLCLIPLPWTWQSVVRSHVFTYVLLPLFVLALVDYRRRRDPRVLVPLPLLMLFWTNAHGGFVLGLGFLGLTALAATFEDRRFALSLWIATIACVLATLVNPYGVAYWVYLREALTMDRSPYITEWRPLIYSPKLVPWVVAVTIPWVAWVVRRLGETPRRLPPEAVLLPAVSLYFALRSTRLTVAYLLVVAVYGAPALAPVAARFRAGLRALPPEWRRSAAIVLVPALLSLGLPVARAALGPAGARLTYDRYPVAALEWLRESRPGGDVLVEFVRGSYALWRLHPKFRVSIDGRYEEVYPQTTFDVVKLALDPGAEGHEEAFRSVRPDYIVLESDAPAVDRPELFGPDWTIAYRDSAFTILESGGDGSPPASSPSSILPVWDPLF